MALQKKSVVPVTPSQNLRSLKSLLRLCIGGEDCVTADFIASKLHVKPSTIYDWAGRSENPLPAYRVTNRHYSLRSEVHACVEGGGPLRRETA
jgi:hypothetical protein